MTCPDRAAHGQLRGLSETDSRAILVRVGFTPAEGGEPFHQSKYGLFVLRTAGTALAFTLVASDFP